MTEAKINKTITHSGMNFVVKNFGTLTSRELMQIYQLRQQVFIIEQNCPYPDIDEADLTALHVFHRAHKNMDAYARILIDDAGDFHIGRVVVSVDKRQQGLGRTLMQAAIAHCRETAINRRIIISAQSYLGKFYRTLGFQETGDYYLEDNIPHMRMIMVSCNHFCEGRYSKPHSV